MEAVATTVEAEVAVEAVHQPTINQQLAPALHYLATLVLLLPSELHSVLCLVVSLLWDSLFCCRCHNIIMWQEDRREEKCLLVCFFLFVDSAHYIVAKTCTFCTQVIPFQNEIKVQPHDLAFSSLSLHVSSIITQSPSPSFYSPLTCALTSISTNIPSNKPPTATPVKIGAWSGQYCFKYLAINPNSSSSTLVV